MAGRRTGPAPQPTERKRLLGNPGKRRLPSSNVIALAPAIVIGPLEARDGDELIRELLATPAAAWIAEPDRLALLVLLRDAWDERLALRADILEHGYGDGRYTRPAVIRLQFVEKVLTTWLSQLGLSPADRSRLGVAEVKARSKLEALRDRRDARNHAG